MSSVHSAWYHDNIHLAQEAAQKAGGALSPTLSLLAAHLAHTAWRDGQITIVQPAAAASVGVSEKSIQGLYQRLVDFGMLKRTNGKRFALGPFFTEHMKYDHGIRFSSRKEAEAEHEGPAPVVNMWRVTLTDTPEENVHELSERMLNFLRPIPGFVALEKAGGGTLRLKASWEELDIDAQAAFKGYEVERIEPKAKR